MYRPFANEFAPTVGSVHGCRFAHGIHREDGPSRHAVLLAYFSE
jgi:hypothetical protein